MHTPTGTADTITLKPSVRLGSPSGQVRLVDVAELDGSEAVAFADLVVAPLSSTTNVTEIPVRDVRAKLEEAGANWGRINLSGRSVVIRPARSATATPPLAMSPMSLVNNRSPQIAQSNRVEQMAADIINIPTLRGAIATLLISNVRIDPRELQLSFECADAELLDTSTHAARFEVQRQSSLTSDRIELAVRIWSGSKVQLSRTVSVLPRLRCQSATLRNDIEKDQVIADTDVVDTDQWLPPSQASQAVNRVSAVGRVASKSLKAGEMLRDKHIRRETLVKRGDVTTVRCLVGGSVISLQAEARADGSEGDTIEFRKQGERETFRATIAARGEAVIDLSRR